MTQPVGSNSPLNYTPYDPDEALCLTEGVGGASSNPNDGAEGAGGAPGAPPAADRDCTAELLGMIGSCGKAVLERKFSMQTFNCVSSTLGWLNCVSEPETKAQGQ